MSKNKFSNIKNIILFLVFLLSSFSFAQDTKAASYGFGKDGSDCIFWNINLDKTIYVPGENIRVDASASNNGCSYDSAWTSVKQTVHNAGLDALSSAGDIGTQYITIPSGTTIGTHNVVVNTYYEHHNYLYMDSYAPVIGYACNCGFKHQSCAWGICIPDGWACDTCWSGGQRIYHSVIGETWGDGGDITRYIPFQVVNPTATLSASSGTDVNNPLNPRSTTTISWTSTNINSMDILINGKPWKASYTGIILTPVYHAEQGYYTAFWNEPCPSYNPTHPDTYCNNVFGINYGQKWVTTQAAYTSNEPINTFIPWTTGSTTTDPLSGGKNTIVFNGYVTGRTTPVITKTLYVYVTTNISINLTSNKNPVTNGFPALLNWTSTHADKCFALKIGTPGEWIPLSANATSGVNISTGNLFASTTFYVRCFNYDPDGSESNSNDAYLEIGVVPGKKPALDLDVVDNEILWNVDGDVYSCALTNQTTNQTISTDLSGDITDYSPLTPTTVIQLSCNTPYGVLSSSTKSTSPASSGACIATQKQTAGGDTNLYINRATTFSMPGAVPSSVSWSGTDLPLIGKKGVTISQVFTKIGKKTIKGVGKTIINGVTSFSSCTADLIFKVDSGVGSGEI